MQYMTIQKNITSSPRKLRLVADLVRNQSPMQALITLKFANKAASIPLTKAIKTVLANSGNREDVAFKTIEINEGPKLKRFRAGSRGHADPYVRRWSHIKVVLTDEVTVKGKKGKVQKVSKADHKIVSEEVAASEVIDSVINEPVEAVIEPEAIEEPKTKKTVKKGAK